MHSILFESRVESHGTLQDGRRNDGRTLERQGVFGRLHTDILATNNHFPIWRAVAHNNYQVSSSYRASLNDCLVPSGELLLKQNNCDNKFPVLPVRRTGWDVVHRGFISIYPYS